MGQSLTVPFDNDVLLMTDMTANEFIEKTRFAMAATLWMDSKITAGQAAKICGMGKVDFLHDLPKHGYPMANIGPDDLKDELQFAHRGRIHG